MSAQGDRLCYYIHYFVRKVLLYSVLSLCVSNVMHPRLVHVVEPTCVDQCCRYSSMLR